MNFYLIVILGLCNILLSCRILWLSRCLREEREASSAIVNIYEANRQRVLRDARQNLFFEGK